VVTLNERTEGAALSLLLVIRPLSLGHQVLLDPLVKPVAMALRAYQAWPESGAKPVLTDMWALLERLDKMGVLAETVYRDLRAQLVRLDLRALPVETAPTVRMEPRGAQEARARRETWEAWAPRDRKDLRVPQR
jgi:hypothetical protein